MHYIEQKQRFAIEQRLDNNEYDENTLFEIKVPLSIPYLNDWATFERVDGEMEYNGRHFKYVKRKIENGYIILKCIPDESKAMLVSARNTFFKLVNDLQTPAKKTGNNNHSVKSFSFEYYQNSVCWSFTNFSFIELFNNHYHTGEVLAAMICLPEKPPEAAVFSV